MKSAQKISEYLNVSLEQAHKIRGLIIGDIDPKTFKSVETWVRQCYNEPHKREQIMCALNEVLEGYGVEGVSDEDNYRIPKLEYVNMGDTYNPTICFFDNDYHFMSWGDAVEHIESKSV